MEKIKSTLTIHDIEKFFQEKFPNERIDHRWPVICSSDIDWEDIFQVVIDLISQSEQEGGKEC